ncbi:hypothetical protein B0H63DRAFT_454823 [Podospora didyma]|uniref:Uncharacterized protein n=1 Tax=Podospora didyma TaxID=330526 RepID=A0AAE0K6Q5_9PEZI|nr:hypothetical protein B0H63DRAFT_454823 [Podospora didyma]
MSGSSYPHQRAEENHSSLKFSLPDLCTLIQNAMLNKTENYINPHNRCGLTLLLCCFKPLKASFDKIQLLQASLKQHLPAPDRDVQSTILSLLRQLKADFKALDRHGNSVIDLAFAALDFYLLGRLNSLQLQFSIFGSTWPPVIDMSSSWSVYKSMRPMISNQELGSQAGAAAWNDTTEHQLAHSLFKGNPVIPFSSVQAAVVKQDKVDYSCSALLRILLEKSPPGAPRNRFPPPRHLVARYFVEALSISVPADAENGNHPLKDLLKAGADPDTRLDDVCIRRSGGGGPTRIRMIEHYLVEDNVYTLDFEEEHRAFWTTQPWRVKRWDEPPPCGHVRPLNYYTDRYDVVVGEEEQNGESSGAGTSNDNSSGGDDDGSDENQRGGEDGEGSVNDNGGTSVDGGSNNADASNEHRDHSHDGSDEHHDDPDYLRDGSDDDEPDDGD